MRNGNSDRLKSIFRLDTQIFCFLFFRSRQEIDHFHTTPKSDEKFRDFKSDCSDAWPIFWRRQWPPFGKV